MVVRDGAVDVVHDVGGSNLVVEEVKDGAIRAVDRVECALDEVPVIALIVGNVNIRVLLYRMRVSVLHVLPWWKTGNESVRPRNRESKLSRASQQWNPCVCLSSEVVFVQ
jgi:hypothetical protein